MQIGQCNASHLSKTVTLRAPVQSAGRDWMARGILVRIEHRTDGMGVDSPRAISQVELLVNAAMEDQYLTLNLLPEFEAEFD